jgi:hypothetical protein
VTVHLKGAPKEITAHPGSRMNHLHPGPGGYWIMGDALDSALFVDAPGGR